jgi:hypothetical protein
LQKRQASLAEDARQLAEEAGQLAEEAGQLEEVFWQTVLSMCLAEDTKLRKNQAKLAYLLFIFTEFLLFANMF